MTPTMWSNDITGERLDADELARLRAKAHVLYEANVHIFEDELDALAVLGRDLGRRRTPPDEGPAAPRTDWVEGAADRDGHVSVFAKGAGIA